MKDKKAIKELADMPKWRQMFTAKATLIEAEIPVNQIVNWLNSYQPFFPKSMQWVPKVFGKYTF
ncbi:MAG: hypothetical protein HRT67_10255 [Flavobacteriaceae bacterium]|nr:hypothetical protein [Flavobacteriaceae bacterium]